MPYHQSLDRAEDEAREERRLGTTGRGIGPTYVDKARRIGLRVGDLLDAAEFRLKLQFVLDRKYHEVAAVGVDAARSRSDRRRSTWRWRSVCARISPKPSRWSTRPSRAAARWCSRAPTPRCSTSTTAPTRT